MPSSGMLPRVALVWTDVSEKRIASITSLTRIDEIGTTLALTSNWRMLRKNSMLFLVHRFFSLWWRRRCFPTKRRCLQEPHGVIFQKTAFFIVTVVKNLKSLIVLFFTSITVRPTIVVIVNYRLSVLCNEVVFLTWKLIVFVTISVVFCEL
jgi:hypothetical protein